ncbi:MAG: hypothetical protein AAF327_13010 [Cyanobacteria bacterium P01_A01_bin.37]
MLTPPLFQNVVIETLSGSCSATSYTNRHYLNPNHIGNLQAYHLCREAYSREDGSREDSSREALSREALSRETLSREACSGILGRGAPQTPALKSKPNRQVST